MITVEVDSRLPSATASPAASLASVGTVPRCQEDAAGNTQRICDEQGSKVPSYRHGTSDDRLTAPEHE